MAMVRARPTAVDPTQPNIARLYDYILGGKDNFAADRDAAETIAAIYPYAALTIKEGRAFVGRVVRYLADEVGIRQFIDVGSGLPTSENVHEVAQRTSPDARVVYVDNDPVAVAHGQALLAAGDGVEMIEGDVRRPAEIIANPDLRGLIDLDEPVAVLMTTLLQWIGDEDDPAGCVAQFRRAMAPGSHLAINHCLVGDPEEDRTYRKPVEAMCRDFGAPLTSRTYAEILRCFDGFDLVDPGLLAVTDWRPSLPHRVEVPTWDEVNESLGEPSPAMAAVINDQMNRKWLLAGGLGRKPG